MCVVACVLVAVAGCNAFIRYDDAGNPKLLPEGAKVDLEFYGDGWHVSQQQSTADDIRNSSLVRRFVRRSVCPRRLTGVCT